VAKRMAQPSARRTALAALRAWRTEKRFADSVITKRLAQTELESQPLLAGFSIRNLEKKFSTCVRRRVEKQVTSRN